MAWRVAEAKEKLSELIRQAGREPQMIYRRHELVAVVVDAGTFERLQPAGEPHRARSLGDAAAEAREALLGEGWDLEIPERGDRDGSFDGVA